MANEVTFRDRKTLNIYTYLYAIMLAHSLTISSTEILIFWGGGGNAIKTLSSLFDRAENVK